MAARVGNLCGIQVGNPVLNIDFSLEGDNDRIFLFRIAGETMNVQNSVYERLHLNNLMILTLVSGNIEQTLQFHAAISASLE